MSDQVNPIQDALTRLATSIKEKGLPCLVIGGNAAIHYGVPRFTRDIDLLVPESAIRNWQGYMSDAGYTKIHSSEAFLQYAPPKTQSPPVDLMVVNDSTWEKLIADATEITLSESSLKVPSAFHLVCLKLHATNSPHRLDTTIDWQDIAQIAKLHHINPDDPKTAALINRYGGESAANRLQQLLKNP